MGGEEDSQKVRARGAWGSSTHSKGPFSALRVGGDGTGRLERPSPRPRGREAAVARDSVWAERPGMGPARGAATWFLRRIFSAAALSSRRRRRAGLGSAGRGGREDVAEPHLARPALRCSFANAVAAATPTAGSRGSLAQEVAEPTLAPSSGLGIEFMLKVKRMNLFTSTVYQCLNFKRVCSFWQFKSTSSN